MDIDRRSILTAIGMSAFAAAAGAQNQQPAPAASDQGPVTTLREVPLSGANTVTAERRGDIVPIGLNRPQIQKRTEPPSDFYRHPRSIRADPGVSRRTRLSSRLDEC